MHYPTMHEKPCMATSHCPGDGIVPKDPLPVASEPSIESDNGQSSADASRAAKALKTSL